LAGMVVQNGLLRVPAWAGSPAATASVQIINATCALAIELKVNNRVVYENFPQGLKTADFPTRLLSAVYEAQDRATGLPATSARINYAPGSFQSLVILGDFSRESPPGQLRQPGRALAADFRPFPPSVLFQVYSHDSSEAPVRLRIVNGMPGKSLTLVAGSTETVVQPGGSAVLAGQPPTAQYIAKVGNESIPFVMRQEGQIRNAMVIFFLRSGRPDFTRAFENTAAAWAEETGAAYGEHDVP
jgi:hypothetical protein